MKDLVDFEQTFKSRRAFVVAFYLDGFKREDEIGDIDMCLYVCVCGVRVATYCLARHDPFLGLGKHEGQKPIPHFVFHQ